MLYRLAADLLVVLHLAFVVFVVLGGFFALRWRQIAWAHVPAALWGAIIEFMGWVCPLTPLENHFRRLAGGGGGGGGASPAAAPRRGAPGPPRAAGRRAQRVGGHRRPRRRPARYPGHGSGDPGVLLGPRQPP